MKIIYITNARIPTEWAHSFQIMKTCEALLNAGAVLELWVPAKKRFIKESPFSFYGVKEVFPIRRFFTFDLARSNKVGFFIQTFSFATAVLLALLRRKEERVIYCRDEIIVAFLSFFGIRNIVWESHDGVWNRWARYAAGSARAIVVVSQGLKDFYVENGVSTERLSVIPNGIDLAAFAHPETKEAARKRLGLPQDAKIALYVGMLDGWKGTDTLFAAAELLYPKIRVAIIGGDDARQLELLRTRFPNVFFLGFHPQRELADNQSAADVLILPNTAKNEIAVRFSSPLKLLSYMASGKPIVASDLPSVRELTGDDAALLVAPDSPQSLAEGIIRAVNDSGISKILIEHAHERIQAYDWSVRAQRILEQI